MPDRGPKGRELVKRLPLIGAKAASLVRGVRGVREERAALERSRYNQAVIALALAQAAPAPAVDPWPPPVSSCLCTQARCASPTYAEWCRRLGLAPLFNRKNWEYAYAAAALDAMGAVGDGCRGVGFGVGREPLPAYLASRGCSVLATDQPSTNDDAARWASTGEYAGGSDGLARTELCDPQMFDTRVAFQAVDMTAVPDDLAGFDFCWSLCAMEHLGSLEAGTRFVERSLQCLRPGGVAVHTTELNILSDDQTLVDGPTVLYRKRDIESLAARLEAKGHAVAALDFDVGDGVLDRYVDGRPWLQWADRPVLRVDLEGFVSTSFALVITAA